MFTCCSINKLTGDCIKWTTFSHIAQARAPPLGVRTCVFALASTTKTPTNPPNGVQPAEQIHLAWSARTPPTNRPCSAAVAAGAGRKYMMYTNINGALRCRPNEPHLDAHSELHTNKPYTHKYTIFCSTAALVATESATRCHLLPNGGGAVGRGGHMNVG